MPVILAIYDAPNDCAHWLYVQEYFEGRRGVHFDQSGATMTVRVPRTQVVTSSTMRQFADYRDRILAQIEGLTHHD